MIKYVLLVLGATFLIVSCKEDKTNRTKELSHQINKIPSESGSFDTVDELISIYETAKGVNIKVKYDNSSTVEIAQVSIGGEKENYYYISNGQSSYGLYKTSDGLKSFIDRGDRIEVENEKAKDGVYIGYLKE